MPSKIKLTTTAVEKLRTAGIYWDTQTPGLGVRVSDSGMRTYFYKRRVKGSGVERNVSLGRHGDPVLSPDGTLRTFPFGAEDARARAAAVQAQLLNGIDPVAEKERKREEEERQAIQDKTLSTTLQQVVDDYLANHRVKGRSLRPKTKLDYRTFMERHFETWLPEPIVGIDRTMCDDKIREIEEDSPVQAHKARVYLRMFLNYAQTDQGEPILPVNPVTRMKTKTHPPEARKRRIPAGKLGSVWLMLRRRAGNPIKEVDRTGADWVSTLLLTGWRATECAALEWSWINFETKTVTLPGDVDTEDERAFAGVKTHATITLPLSDALYEILKARKELESADERYVYPARDGSKVPHIISANGTMRALGEIAGCRVSPHDLRRTAVSVAKACRVDYGDRMHLLNHSSKNVHDDYERDDDPETLRPAVNAIAKYIIDAAAVAEAQESGANVINLADRKAGKTA